MKFKLLVGLSLILLGLRSAHAASNFTSESGIQIAAGTPFSVDTTTVPYRLYFGRNGSQILSATSASGLAWSEETGVRIATNTLPVISASSFSITGATVLRLAGGGYRMAYSAASSVFGWQVVSATSSDGLAWANQSTPLVSSSSTFVGSPQLVKLTDGNWRIYFLRDSNGGNDLTDRIVYTSLSTDEGVTWSAAAPALAQYATDLSASVRTDDRVRLYLGRPLSSETTSSTLISALSSSSEGTAFDLESGIRFSTTSASGAIGTAAIFRSTETFRWRLLYGFTAAGTTSAAIHSALTLDPAPDSLSPSPVLRTTPASAFTISGEVFGSTPTMALTRSGETDIAGTAITRNSDLSLTATFNITDRALGFWDLLVTNPDGRATTLSNALQITFANGNVSLTDNLLRPRNGARTRIDITIFDAGNVTVDVYTLEGQLVNSLYNANASLGSLTVFWDGKTGDGNIVGSGVYFIRVKGPKVDDKAKVVVIR